MAVTAIRGCFRRATALSCVLLGTLVILLDCVSTAAVPPVAVLSGLSAFSGAPAVNLPASFTRQTGNGESSSNGGKAAKVVILRNQLAMDKAMAMCLSDRQALLRLANESSSNVTDCFLPGACRLVYRDLLGFAADFTDPQMDAVENCLGGDILIFEDDIEVRKAEHDYSLLLSTGYGRLLLQEAPSSSTPGQGGGGEGPNFSPALWAISAPFQADSSELSAAGLQSSYFNSTLYSGLGAEYVSGFKVQQLHTAQWNLDRIDQRSPPLDRQYGFGTLKGPGTGRGVTIYVVDSGIKSSHQEFKSWTDGTSRASSGYDFADMTSDASDCDGHGTHVASTAVGRAVGLAKEANVVAVRVLNCQGSGTVSNVVAGLNWVAQHAVKPAVVTMSLGVPIGQWSDALNHTVSWIINNCNITAVVAAGNSKIDSCTIVPANVAQAITVAAMDLSDKFQADTANSQDELYSWDNSGSCVSIFAPGVDILAACGGLYRCPTLNDTAYTWASGTSMAVPHVAGLAAIYLGNHPSAAPAEVKGAIISGATQGKLNFTNSGVLSGTPNLIINTLMTGGGDIVTASEGPQGRR